MVSERRLARYVAGLVVDAPDGAKDLVGEAMNQFVVLTMTPLPEEADGKQPAWPVLDKDGVVIQGQRPARLNLT